MTIRILVSGAALLGLLLATPPAASAQSTVTPRQTTAETPVAPATLEQLTDSLTLFQGLADAFQDGRIEIPPLFLERRNRFFAA